MSLFDLLVHLANFLAPAMAVGSLLALAAPLIERRLPAGVVFARQAAVNALVCGAVLVVGLWFFGRDGKMATYGALVLAGASSQWLQMMRRA